MGLSGAPREWVEVTAEAGSVVDRREETETPTGSACHPKCWPDSQGLEGEKERKKEGIILFLFYVFNETKKEGIGKKRAVGGAIYCLV